MNLLPLEPARISLPARPFVLLKDNLRDPVGVGAQPSERLGAQLGVSFDEVPFIGAQRAWLVQDLFGDQAHPEDRKSTRLNSSHGYISYAVFCLKKKK